MSWMRRLLPAVKSKEAKDIPEGLWHKCDGCDAILYHVELDRNLRVCPKCNHHMPIAARKRLDHFLDAEPREEIGADVMPIDHLKFREGKKKYKDRLVTTQKATGETEALIVIQGHVLGIPLVSAAFEFQFVGGSMGSGVGERFVRGVARAIEAKIPFVCFTASGGARMQEGLISLFQMAKTSAALSKLAEARLPYLVVLTHPTMGGVSASLATLGDILIAEPEALIGFSGARVMETIGETLPPGFQRSAFLLEHGMIDMIVDRRELRTRVAGLLAKLTHQVTGPIPKKEPLSG